MENPTPILGRSIGKSTVISLEKGKIPPQAIDLEEVVLGAMLIDKKGVDEVIENKSTIRPSDNISIHNCII